MKHVKCNHCKSGFLVDVKRYNHNKKLNYKFYCDWNCWKSYTNKRNIQVRCSCCNKKISRHKNCQAKTGKYFCKDCRGMVVAKCNNCKKPISRTKYDARHYVNLYCSSKCHAIGRRKNWDKLSRNMLKIRWVAEFGKETLICNRCGYDKSYNIQLHHKKYVKNGGGNQPDNLEPLCRNCHGEEHYKNGIDNDFNKFNIT